MFRGMRRKAQQLAEEDCIAILRKNTSGVLALLGDDGYPYALPISYALVGRSIIFHSALSGHKIDAVRKCRKASFCVIDKDEVIPEKYTTRYRSVIAFGKITIIDDEDGKRRLIEKLADRFAPANPKERRDMEIDSSWPAFCVLSLDIEHMTGKQGRDLLENP